MVFKCAVYGCKGNYASGQKVSIFRFPKDPELVKIWESRTMRKNFKATSNSRVCELHFRKEDVLREAEFFDEKSGRLLVTQLAYPKLKEGAIPVVISPECPSSLQPTVSKARVSPAKKRSRLEDELLRKAQEASLQTEKDYQQRVTFTNVNELKTCLMRESIDAFWTVVSKSNSNCISIIHLTDLPDVLCSLNIDSELNISIVYKKVKLDKLKSYKFPLKVTNTNILFDILSSLKMLAQSSDSEDSEFETILNILTDLLSRAKVLASKFEEDNVKFFEFLIEQLVNLNKPKQHRKYSHEFLIFCSLLKSISPHSYKFMRSSKMFILPHESTLRRVCSQFGVNPSKEQNEDTFLSYIAQKYNFLNDDEKIISLMIDEIHLRPNYDFVGGELYGMSHNSSKAATSAYVFMVQSFLSKYKDVAHILPVSTITADMLFSVMKKIILGLESIGFLVIVVVTDNNAINKKAISKFSNPPSLQVKYVNPACPERYFFFVFDSVHILKCVRNNWLCQKNFGKCMFYPNFNDLSLFKTTSFQALKELHGVESERLLKFGYGLTEKALSPTSFERQNVKLVLQIFNNVVAEGLEQVGGKKNIPFYQDTADYLKLIYRWWCIMNVKTLFKGEHKLDVFQKPLEKKLMDDPKCKFLVKFGKWLKKWDEMGCTTGGLTKPTRIAIAHTTEGMLALAEYCFKTLGFEYFLPGKVQTDPLEDRFGCYRRLAGTNYNVSIRQIYESEEKMRMQSILPLQLKSNSKGEYNLSFFDDKNWDCSEFNFVHECYDNFYINSDNLSATEEYLPLLTYISGYAAHTVLKKINCVSCRPTLIIEKDLNVNMKNDWIAKLDRGGLKYPHPEVVCICQYSFAVVTELLSVNYEEKFLKCKDHRGLSKSMIMEVLDENDVFLSIEECEKHDSIFLVKKIVWVFVNIFLNNFCKKQNDCIRKQKMVKKEKVLIKKTKQEARKLSTVDK